MDVVGDRRDFYPAYEDLALPQQWRLIYTLHTFSEGEKPRALLLELMDHDQYNKRFGYFKKKSS